MAFRFTLLFFLVLNTAATAQQSVNRDAAQACSLLFSQFRGRKIDYTIVGEGKETAAGMEATADVFPNRSLRGSYHFPPKPGKSGKLIQMRQEFLFQANHQFLYGEQIFTEDEVDKFRPSSREEVSGKMDWRIEDALGHQMHSIWLGYLMFGDRAVDLESEEFWKSVATQKTSAGFVGAANGNSIRITLADHRGENLIQQISVAFPSQTDSNKRIEMEISFSYQPETNVPSSWMLKDRFVGNEYTRGKVAKIREIGTLTENEIPLKFSTLEIANETEVYMRSQRNVHFQYVDGLIMKTVDGKAEQEIEKLKPAEKQQPPPDKIDGVNLVVRSDYLGIANARHCGVYSFAAAAACLGVDVEGVHR